MAAALEPSNRVHQSLVFGVVRCAMLVDGASITNNQLDVLCASDLLVPLVVFFSWLGMCLRIRGEYPILSLGLKIAWHSGQMICWAYLDKQLTMVGIH